MMVASPGFIHYDNTKTLLKIASEVPEVKRFVIMDDLEGKYVMSNHLDRSAKYEEYIANSGSSKLPDISISPHDMVNVQFTSGESS